jgi:hypothetical protein
MQMQTAATIMAPTPQATSVAQIEDTEMHRWTLMLGILMIAACVCVALAFGTHYHWFYGGAILFGPGLCVLAIIYLAISSDTNGTNATAGHELAAHTGQLEPLPEAAAA